VAAEKRRSHDGGLRSGFGDLRSSVNSSVKTATAWGRTDPTAAARDWAVVVVKTAPGMKLAAPDRAACRYLDPPSYGMMRGGGGKVRPGGRCASVSGRLLQAPAALVLLVLEMDGGVSCEVR
jgi:hypothetical protein